MRLDALPSASAEELLEALLGSDPSLEPLERLLIERTEGNPFFLEESVRTLVETKALEGAPGAYRLTRAPAGLQIPATAQAILAARIDRLSPEDKRLLQTASVVGKDVPYNLLHAVIDEGEDALRLGLARLQAAEFLYETRLFPELEYTFKHALTHEVAYGGLLHDRRRGLHARIADAIETTYAGRIGEQVERLAHHAVGGQAWAKAVLYLDQAAAKERSRSAHREAVAFLEEARLALRRLPEDRQTIERAIDLRLDLRASLVMLEELDRVREVLDEAEACARSIGDDHRLGYVLTCRGHYY